MARAREVDLPTVKEILGQRKIEMTQIRYSHLAATHKAKALDRLGEVLEKTTRLKKEKRQKRGIKQNSRLATNWEECGTFSWLEAVADCRWLARKSQRIKQLSCRVIGGAEANRTLDLLNAIQNPQS